jgi:hypothetical protein
MTRKKGQEPICGSAPDPFLLSELRRGSRGLHFGRWPRERPDVPRLDSTVPAEPGRGVRERSERCRPVPTGCPDSSGVSRASPSPLHSCPSPRPKPRPSPSSANGSAPIIATSTVPFTTNGVTPTPLAFEATPVARTAGTTARLKCIRDSGAGRMVTGSTRPSRHFALTRASGPPGTTIEEPGRLGPLERWNGRCRVGGG